MEQQYEHGDDNNSKKTQDQDDLEEGEELEDAQGGLDYVLPPPPPPPPLLRLVIYHSTQNSGGNLLPSHQTLALLDGTTTIGRDKSYEPRIRLKTLEVSRTHATIFQEDQQQQLYDQAGLDSSNSTGPRWFIVDNASTHGTFIRRHGEEHYSRFSEKGQSSLPKELRHLDTIKVANQRFIVHLHLDQPCESCSLNADRSNLIPLLEDSCSNNTTTSNQSLLLPNASLQALAPMSEHAAKTFSKEEKQQSFRTDMKSLRKNLLTSGGAASTYKSTPLPSSKRNDKAPMTSTSDVATEEGTDSSSKEEAQEYVDRAKLRRKMHPDIAGPQQQVHTSKRSRLLSSPPVSHVSEPSYGPGAALFQKMLSTGGNNSIIGTDTRSASDGVGGGGSHGVSDAQHNAAPERSMGKIIEVKTMEDRKAGLGSGAIRTGVEQHAEPTTDWRDVARQRRWREANR